MSHYIMYVIPVVSLPIQSRIHELEKQLREEQWHRKRIQDQTAQVNVQYLILLSCTLHCIPGVF